MKKSYKREFALLMWLHLVGLSFYGDYHALEIIAWPYMLFIFGAFGLQTLVTQTDVFKKADKNADNDKP